MNTVGERLTICCCSTHHFHEKLKSFFIVIHFPLCKLVNQKPLMLHTSSFDSLFIEDKKRLLKCHDDNFLPVFSPFAVISTFYLCQEKCFSLFVNDINHEKDKKKCKSHLRASILVSPKMHKSLGNYSYMSSRKERNATRTWTGMKSIITHIFLFHDSTGTHLSQ